MNPKFKRKTIPSQAHPLVKVVFEEMNRLEINYSDLSDKSGIGIKVFERWRKNVQPQLQTLETVFKALNLELKVERKNGLQ